MDNKFKIFKKQLETIYQNNQIYHDKMMNKNITPEDINDWKDISKLPFTTKKDLLEMEDNIKNNKIKVYHASSGTTGRPLIVGLTKKDIKFRKEQIINNLKMSGITKKDTVQICLGFGMFTGGLSFYDGLRDLGCTIIPTGTLSTEMQLYYMKELKATVLISSPSQVMHLYEKAKSLKINVQDLSIRIIRVGSELLTESMRKKIKQAWGQNVSVTQDYGMTETLGPGLAMECQEEQGMHLNPNYYFELINPITNEHTASKTGELVVTTIYSEGFPLIRYKTSDLIEIDEAPCTCHNDTPRISKFLGRTDDMLKVKGVKVFVSQIENFLFNYPYFSHQYEIVLSKEKYKDRLTINIEYNNSLINIDKINIADYEIEVEEQFKNKFGIKSKINILDSNTLQISPGKIVRVRDLRTENITNT